MRFEMIRRGTKSLKRYGFIEYTTSRGLMLRIFGVTNKSNILYGKNKVIFAEIVKIIGKHYQLCNYSDTRPSSLRQMAEVHRLSRKEVKSFKWVRS